MASFEKAQKIFNNWDKEAFRTVHHDGYIYSGI